MDGFDLRPFPHQVSGHTGLFMTGAASVCKPTTSVSREADFYLHLPSFIRRFAPHFHGTMEVDVSASPASASHLPDSPASPAPASAPSASLFLDSSGQLHLGNPWGVKCQTNTLTRMIGNKKKKHSFLVLENLVKDYEHPCILDLKVGTQQHGDDATEQKRLDQTRKCLRTTSAGLGVRLCGMQVFERESGAFRCTDKYQGRSLNTTQLAERLRDFLLASPDGEGLRKKFLAELRMLLEVVERAEGCRFYSSSLLLLYDNAAEPAAPASPPRFLNSLHMVDFEHSTFRGFRSDPVHIGPDSGYCKGIRSLVSIFSDADWFRDVREESTPQWEVETNEQ